MAQSNVRCGHKVDSTVVKVSGRTLELPLRDGSGTDAGEAGPKEKHGSGRPGVERPGPENWFAREHAPSCAAQPGLTPRCSRGPSCARLFKHFTSNMLYTPNVVPTPTH
ncbi:uncharacterized protein VDAG_03066 [Verticillium dahliae VdLs.17]|uniref:Uncharacterized protein n=1 Tax=Verticillium dahliae (strain VdLs.17 / ATCC MYA-4575 / FGSC 10137) TaxID=498257 RepID=G2X043_VERDV|nr:uncharacterized protein VDAG_03066 [Verticillium dahliae VdLs.17]EGY21626.1 hypothetical protein VDAG_03066 [Verticillium dahliae VdLs.17]